MGRQAEGRKVSHRQPEQRDPVTKGNGATEQGNRLKHHAHQHMLTTGYSAQHDTGQAEGGEGTPYNVLERCTAHSWKKKKSNTAPQKHGSPSPSHSVHNNTPVPPCWTRLLAATVAEVALGTNLHRANHASRGALKAQGAWSGAVRGHQACLGTIATRGARCLPGETTHASTGRENTRFDHWDKSTEKISFTEL